MKKTMARLRAWSCKSSDSSAAIERKGRSQSRSLFLLLQMIIEARPPRFSPFFDTLRPLFWKMSLVCQSFAGLRRRRKGRSPPLSSDRLRILHHPNFYISSKNDSNWKLSSLARLTPLLASTFSFPYPCLSLTTACLTKHKTLLHLADVLPKSFFSETNNILNDRTQTFLTVPNL